MINGILKELPFIISVSLSTIVVTLLDKRFNIISKKIKKIKHIEVKLFIIYVLLAVILSILFEKHNFTTNVILGFTLGAFMPVFSKKKI